MAIFSDADADSPHVQEADSAVRLPGNTPAETYLRIDSILAAAQVSGADAIHPGYGFLSENAQFARAVLDAGLTWIGPPVNSIELMGSKIESKKIMAAAGVPVLTRLDPAALTVADLPVLIKASSGGGGRGMRVVRNLADLPAEIEAAQREAASAFGDPTVFCERYVETGHHIEVQVMADRYGTVWAVGERECSIQRRHQKVVEEAPSPLVEKHSPGVSGTVSGMRQKLFEAAKLAATAIGYEGAGTVEFLADSDGSFYFLEMNTRLQVEHPVTENTTGLDLVALQLHVAAGGRLAADPPLLRGHSIEVRLYAEDPAKDWQPQSGTLFRFEVPDVLSEFSVLTETGIRLDSGVIDGSVVGVHYDPMLAKIISTAPTRLEAARVLASALMRSTVHGLVTNVALLVNILRHPAFLTGDTDTAFFATHGIDQLSVSLADLDAERLSAVAATLADVAANHLAAKVNSGIPVGWRNISSQLNHKVYQVQDRVYDIGYQISRSGLKVEGYQDISLISANPDSVIIEYQGIRRSFQIARYADIRQVDSSLGPVALTVAPRFIDPASVVALGSLLAPMPGTVIRLGAEMGDHVESGQTVLWLEAMKMEHAIAAPAAGIITQLNVAVGQQVDVGNVLAVVEDTERYTTTEESK